MSELIYLELPTVEKDASLSSHPFYVWLLNQPERPKGDYIDYFDQWAAQYGFTVGVHHTNDEVLEQIKLCTNDVYMYWYANKNKINFDAWFIPCHATDHQRFYLQGNKSHSYFQLSGTALQFFKSNDLGLVYDLLPEHYYFSLNEEGILWIKYQSIIGQRCIASIKKRGSNYV